MRFHFALISISLVLLASCGGGAGETPPSPPAPVITPEPEAEQAPPASFRLEAESPILYSDSSPENKGGAGNLSQAVDLEETSDVGGGLNLSWTEAGEWLEYRITIPESAQYLVTFRLAAESSGGQFDILIDGEYRQTVSVFATGAWQQWVDTQQAVGELTAGEHTLRLEIKQGLFNLNYMDFAPGTMPNQIAEVTEDSLTAVTAVAAMGNGVNIGQVFETATGSAREFAPVRRKIDAYYALGFRHVRVPVTWSVAIDGSPLIDTSSGEVNPNHPRLAVIKEVVDYALSLPDMWVILNAHHEVPIKENNQWWVLAQLWQDVAEMFSSRSHRLIFELLNEPHDASGAAMAPFDLRNMSQLAYTRIRQIDPFRLVAISGNQWGGAYELPRTWPSLADVGGGQDPYLMATFHHYDPWVEFHSEDTPTRDFPFTDDTLRGPMQQAENWRQSLGVELPIYIGEWGVGWGKLKNTMTCNNVREWYQRFPGAAAAFSMPTTVWDDGGWFGSFNYEQGSFENNLAQCITGDCEWDGNERFNEGCY